MCRQIPCSICKFPFCADDYLVKEEDVVEQRKFRCPNCLSIFEKEKPDLLYKPSEIKE